MIKANHFSIGHEGSPIKGHYNSITQNSYTGAANPQRTFLDEARKKDLRESHFQIGGKDEPGVRRSTHGATYLRPGTTGVQFNSERQKDLKNSHFDVGQSG